MPQRVINWDGKDSQIPAETRTLMSYKRRWLKATGTDMPVEVQALDLQTILVALLRTEKGDTMVVPKSPVTVSGEDGDLVYWDTRSEY